MVFSGARRIVDVEVSSGNGSLVSEQQSAIESDGEVGATLNIAGCETCALPCVCVLFHIARHALSHIIVVHVCRHCCRRRRRRRKDKITREHFATHTGVQCSTNQSGDTFVNTQTPKHEC